MEYLLDTCSVSELITTNPDLAVKEVLTSLPREGIWISIITIGEVQKGISELEESRKRSWLEKWLHDHLLPTYVDRFIPIDTEIALRWGMLTGELVSNGLTMPVNDAWIAATALTHDLTLVTRNESDFSHAGVRILNPWK